MRRVASIVLLVLAGVMFPVLVLSNWAGSNLYNSDSFSERAVEPLCLALKDSDSFVRRSAAEALGRLGSERAGAAGG